MTELEAHALEVAIRWAAMRVAAREGKRAAPTRAEVLAAEMALERAALALGGAA